MPPATPEKKKSAKQPAQKRRRYNSPLRQQQSAETRESIVAAGADLVRRQSTWDWKNLNAGAVSERAGVSERTVRRYFSTDNHLRAAVLQRMVEESGLRLEELALDNYADTVGQAFRYLRSFAVEPAAVDTPLEDFDRRRRESLVQAVADATPDWSEREREMAAAALDIFWQPSLYERLTMTWGIETERAVGIVGWLIGLIEEAIREDRFPQASGRASRTGKHSGKNKPR